MGRIVDRLPVLLVGLLVLLAATSCVSMTERLTTLQAEFAASLAASADSQQAALEEFKAQQAAALAELAAGTLSNEDYIERMATLSADRDAKVSAALNALQAESKADWDSFREGVEADVSLAKADAAGAAAKVAGAVSGVLGLGPLGDLAGTALVAAFGANTYRNRKRTLRGEPV